MLDILKFIGWIFSWPFLFIWLLIEFHSCSVAGKRYKKDPTSSTQEERYEKIKKLVNHFLYWKRIKVEIVGKEKIDKKVMLFVANHKSNADPLVVLKTILSQDVPYVTFIAKKELEDTKLGHAMDLIDTIYVERGNLREVPKIIDEMVKTMQNKVSICLFAEGTRVHGDEFADFKPTLLEAAYRTHLSVQPTVIYNTDGLLDKGYKRPKNKTVKINYLPSINAASFINIDRNNFMKKIQTTMFEEYQKIKNNSYA